MCRDVCHESSGGMGECYCIGTFSAKDEMRKLEAMKTLEKIRLDGIEWRIEELRKTVKE